MRKSRLYLRSFFICLLIAFAILFVTFSCGIKDNAKINNEPLIDFSDAWQVYSGSSFVGEQDMPTRVTAPANTTVRIEKNIPADLHQNSTLFFRTIHSYVNVYADGELLHSFGHGTKLPYGKSPGNAWQIVRIPPSSCGTTLAIEFSSPYKQVSGSIGNIYIGTKAAIVFSIIKDNIFAAVIGFFILIAGIVMLLLYILSKDTIVRRSLLYLSTFSILLGIWSIGESRIMQFLIGDSFFNMNLIFIVFLLLPISFVLFLLSLDCFKNDKIIRFGGFAFIANFVLDNVLQFLNIADYYQMLPLTDALILLMCAYVVWLFIFHQNIDRSRELHTICVLINLLLIISSISILLFFFGHATASTSLMSVGFLMFVVLLAFGFGRRVINNYSERIEREAYRTMAYKDALTRLQNRTAFEEEMDKYRNGEKGNAVFVELDLDNLKLINDKHSHRCGDVALEKAAQYIKDAFANLGNCYRIGGDEFSVIIPGIDIDRVMQALEQMTDKMQQDNKTREISIVLSYGVSQYDKGCSNVDDVLNLADEKMYLCKMKTKADM